MTTLLWVVLTPLVLILLAIAVFFGKAIVSGAREGWREEMSKNNANGDAYELPEECAALGLLPRGELDKSSPGPRPEALAAALAAVEAGDWKPAAELMRGTARTKDWERRAYDVGILCGNAAVDDTWLLAWESAVPDDPDAAVLRAWSTVSLAGKLRGAQRAQNTTSEQFDAFHRTLARARAEIARAAELNPEDPTPYLSEISAALGLGYPHAEMDRIWAEVTARAPHHYAAHWFALQYWCKKWRGSEQLAHAFAAEAVAGAPLGSLMTVFPLIAHFEHDDTSNGDFTKTPEVLALVDAALADVAAADPAHPRLVEARHMLAYFLSFQDRDAEAVEQFKLVDGYVGSLPWFYESDPTRLYCHLRDLSVQAAAKPS
ncbi:hypothetical protein [Streptomyces sp. NPDC060198]|uniref:hypothetical protein n=1 Tax=Streptomyces sp. NPDC060198 TaxID=3347070 RepID=UPI00366A1779